MEIKREITKSSSTPQTSLYNLVLCSIFFSPKGLQAKQFIYLDLKQDKMLKCDQELQFLKYRKCSYSLYAKIVYHPHWVLRIIPWKCSDLIPEFKTVRIEGKELGHSKYWKANFPRVAQKHYLAQYKPQWQVRLELKVGWINFIIQIIFQTEARLSIF
jgi:hypothetical protein